ncbi:hypothetical protein TNCV_480431 [Trichonephila clavipes]|nr:hypothetical protein TNCV_480431 [Trichonephila clavipes]
MPQGGLQHLEKVRSSPYPGKVCPPLLKILLFPKCGSLTNAMNNELRKFEHRSNVKVEPGSGIPHSKLPNKLENFVLRLI